MSTRAWIRLNGKTMTAIAHSMTDHGAERPLPLTPAEKRIAKIGVPARFFRKPATRHKPWIAFSLRPFYLSVLCASSLGFLAACESLRQISNRNNGLLFFNDTSEITTWDFIAYNYVPTILAVLYVTAWSLVDLDIKRLEPYFQLSIHNTITANILFLDYTFEYSINSPFRALWRTHWTIVFTSFTFLLISLILPPLQSSLIGVASVTLDEPTTFQSWQKLKDAKALSEELSPEYINHVRSIIQDGATLPSYATYDYAVSPFKANAREQLSNETWAVNTQIFWVEPSCQEIPNQGQFRVPPDEVEMEGDTDVVLSWVISNISTPDYPNKNSSCSLTAAYTYEQGVGDNSSIISSLWVDLNEPLDTNLSMSTMLSNGCKAFSYFGALYTFNNLSFSSSNGRLLPSTNESLAPTTFNAVLCQPKYYFAPADITVRADNGSVITVKNRGRPRDCSSQAIVKKFISLVRGRHSLNTIFLGGGTMGTLAETYLDSKKGVFASSHSIDSNGSAQFHEAIENVYKLLFVLVLSDNIDNSTQPLNLTGFSYRDTNALVIASPFAIISEVILSIGALTAIRTLVLYKKRQNILRSDPDSIGALCSLVADCFNQVKPLTTRELDKTSTKGLEELMANAKCHRRVRGDKEMIDIEYTASTQGRTAQTCYLQSGDNLLRSSLGTHTQSNIPNIKDAYDRLPFFVTRPGFIIATLVLVGTIIGFSLLLKSAINDGGFRYLAESNIFTQQLLWSFTPTLIATMIESALLVVHRDLSLFQSWTKLRAGNVLARRSLSLRYASRPPAAILLGTFKNRDFLLFFISLTSISSSILNIAMGGLFSQSFTTVQSAPMNFTSKYTQTRLIANLPEISDVETDLTTNEIQGGFEVVRTNITDGTRLGPWSTTNYFLMPLVIPSDVQNAQTVFQATTTGIGAKLDCTKFPLTNSTTNALGISYNPNAIDGHNATAGYFYWQVEIDGEMTNANSTTVTCASFFPIVQNFSLFPQAWWSNKGKFEPSTLLDPHFREYNGYCDLGPIVVITNRQTKPSSMITASPLALICQYTVDIADFDIQFDSQGYIAAYDKSNDSSANNTSLLSADKDYLSNFRLLFSPMTGLASAIYGDQTYTNLPQYDWPGLLMARLDAMQSSHFGNDTARYSQLASDTFSRIFSAYFSLVRDIQLNKNGTRHEVQVVAQYREARMVPSIPSFVVTFILLVLYIFALILVIIFRRQRYSGPRMPISLGSLIPWIAHSKMLKDFEGTHHLSSDLRDEYLASIHKKYGFGWFYGTDGTLHLGVEQEPLLDRYILDTR